MRDKVELPWCFEHELLALDNICPRGSLEVKAECDIALATLTRNETSPIADVNRVRKDTGSSYADVAYCKILLCDCEWCVGVTTDG